MPFLSLPIALHTHKLDKNYVYNFFLVCKKLLLKALNNSKIIKIKKIIIKLLNYY